VPGGAIFRPDDGQEHVHGRWFCLKGTADGDNTALAVINNGQHGLDFKDGEVPRLLFMRICLLDQLRIHQWQQQHPPDDRSYRDRSSERDVKTGFFGGIDQGDNLLA
jgi:hypothetical protein